MMRRYDLFLLLKYNDGSFIETNKFTDDENELLALFGAFIVNSMSAPYKGSWKFGGVEYRDDILIFLIFADDDRVSEQFFINYKEVLKERFQQIEIILAFQEIYRD